MLRKEKNERKKKMESIRNFDKKNVIGKGGKEMNKKEIYENVVEMFKK